MTTKKKLKIAFIHPDLGIGGAERLVLDAATALTRRGHEVFFLTNHCDKNHAFEEVKNGDFPVQVYGDWLPRSVFGKCQALCAYIRMIYLTLTYLLFYRNKDNPDLYFVDLIPMANIILKIFNEKVLYYCHHPDLLSSVPGGKLKSFYRKPINKLELYGTAKADVILVNSEYTASVFHETFPEITKPIKVLYPTIAFTYQEILIHLGRPKLISEIVPEVPENAVTFLSINRFHPAKKLDLAINAMAALKQILAKNQWSSVFLIMMGGYDPQSSINSEYYDLLQQITEEQDLRDKVIFIKSPSDSVKAAILQSCDCLVYTPVKEHFGIVPLEAMAVSKPVIACDSGGPRETVINEVTGFLCEPQAKSMANAMKKILNGGAAKEMGAKGKRVLEERFSFDSFASQLNQIVETVN